MSGVEPLNASAFEGVKARFVVSTLGVTSGSEEALAENVRLTRFAQEIGASVGARRVFHFATGAIYAPSAQTLTEDSETVPRHAYGRSKLMAELAVPAARAHRATFLRLGNVAGADALFRAFSRNELVTLDRFSDGRGPQRTYVAPDDLVKVLIHLMYNRVEELPHALNVGGRVPVDMAEIVKARNIPMQRVAAPATALPIQWLSVDRLSGLGITMSKSSDPAHLASFTYPDEKDFGHETSL